MKKISLTLLLICSSFLAFSQVLPSFQFGLKGGLNLAKFKTTGGLDADNQAGFYAGVWTRIGAAGIHLQPELYIAKKSSESKTTGANNDIKYTSLDIPVLVGTKIGAAGIGLRLNTGPVVSFVLDEDQSFVQAAGAAANGSIKDQAFAWQFGTGLDVGKLGVDLRYELGLTKIYTFGNTNPTKLNLFTLGLAYKLF
jgi:hypothetical protein